MVSSGDVWGWQVSAGEERAWDLAYEEPAWGLAYQSGEGLAWDHRSGEGLAWDHRSDEEQVELAYQSGEELVQVV